MSYFDNANNRVTRKKFGSKIDKEFKREGVIPVRERKKDEFNAVAEAAKQAELDKKVNDRRLNEMKQNKEFDTKMQEGYAGLKDELIKDFIGELVVESLIIDEEDVNTNLKNILEMVNLQVEDLGGFEGIKRASDNNPIVSRMINICEAMVKKVGERNLRESQGKPEKLNFSLNKLELEEYDYRKKEMGSEVIINNIKDKVFQVIQDEQKLNTDRQMIIDDIQSKVSELEVPVGEAMEFIFGSNGVEEETLFNSLMRRNYKSLIENNSSAIFESFDYKQEAEPVFEEKEFELSDIELVDDEEYEDEIEDMFLNEAYKVEGMYLEDVLETLYQNLYNSSQEIQSKSEALKHKALVRRIQETIEDFTGLEEGLIKNIKNKKRVSEIRYAEDAVDSWKFQLELATEKNFNKIVKLLRKEIENREVLLNTKQPKFAFIEGEMEKYVKWLAGEYTNFDCTNETPEKLINRCEKRLNSVEESYEGLNRAEILRKRLLQKVQESSTDDLTGDVASDMKKMANDAKKSGAMKKEVTEEVILCPKCGKEECKCKVAKESLINEYNDKLEEICENMNKIIEAHEQARNNVLESLSYNQQMVPFIQARDIDSTNIEFVYKVKLVCESLKRSIEKVEYLQEANIIEKAVELNIESINETLSLIQDRDEYAYKTKILKVGKKYLEKVQENIDSTNFEYNDNVLESTDLFRSVEDVERVFNQVKEYYVLESVNTDTMEVVMAESIVEYTILETLNTIKLVNFTKDSVRQMARKNISYVSEGLFGKK